MYHVTTIGAISVILYLLSYFGYRSGIIDYRDHRSAWNILLLVTFLFTAIAGLLLALQATYKWDSPGLRQFLKWHVEAGTGMTFIALFHFSWHLRYYLSLFKGRAVSVEDIPAGQPDRTAGGKAGLANLFILGLFTGIVQLVFIREVLNLSGGYELITGVIFFCWLVLSAIGAYITGRRKLSAKSRLLYILPLSGLLSAALLLVCSRLMLAIGEYPTFLKSLLISFIALIPVCFISGALFIILTSQQMAAGGREPGSSFGIETTGGIISGLFVSIAGGSFLGNYQMLLLSSFLVMAFLLSINIKERGKKVNSGIVALMILAGAVILFSPDRFIRSIYLRGTSVEKSIDSRYGNISVTDYYGEKNILYNHRLYSYPEDRESAEENIHYAMLQHPSPRSVLLISGGLVKHYAEIKKYKTVEEITYIEKDPRIIDQEKLLNTFPLDSILRVVNLDAFSYLKRNSEKYDVIIMLIPYPSNLESNRYFTIEFYNIVKMHLNKGGVFLTTAGQGSNYPGEGAANALAATAGSLRQEFENILPVKGSRTYIIASDAKTRLDFPGMVEERNIDNQYVNRYYLDSTIIAFNSSQLSLVMSSKGDNLNSLAEPSLVYFNQKHELSKESGNSSAIIILFAALSSLPLFLGKRNSRRLFAASFNLAGIEIISLVVMQSTMGSMYQYTGIIISILMTGLAAGAFSKLKGSVLNAGIIPVILVISTLITALVTGPLINFSKGIVVFPSLILIIFIPAFLTGRLYRTSSSNDPLIGSVSGLYGSDLFGAAAGFLVVSSFMIPLAGLQNSLLILAFFNFAAYLTTIRKGKG